MALTDRLRGLLGAQSARSVSFAVTMITMLSKPAGYVRMLITAWLFGTSAGMDSYHLAYGIAMLFATSVGGALQNSLVPELERVKDDDGARARSLFALAACVVLAACALMCAAFIIAPGLIVKFFAGGFDSERVRIGAVMMLWLTPLAAATVVRPLFEIWAMFRKKYTIGAISSLIFNAAAIPAILIAAPVIGVYSVAAGTSAGTVISLVVLAAAIGGIPIRFSPRLIAAESIKRIARDASLTFVLTTMGGLYMMIDRYFASLLPVGAVAAISYGGTIISLLTTAATTPMLFFLSRISAAVRADRVAARETAAEAMALIAAYFVPVSLFLAACARGAVSLIYGWGSFDQRSVEMTASVLSAYSFGFVFSLMTGFMNTYAAASEQLKKLVVLSALGIVINTTLNWILVERFGLIGLAAATSLSQIIGWCVSFTFIIGMSAPKFFIKSRLLVHAAASGALAALSLSASGLGSAPHIAVCAAFGAAYLFASERLGLMPMVPEHWRPAAVLRFFMSTARRRNDHAM